MSEHFIFETPWVLYAGLPLALLALFVSCFTLRRAKLSPWRTTAMAVLRAAVILLLIFLAARPVMETRQDEHRKKGVVVLLDRSESMSLTEKGESRSRYQQMTKFAAEQLGPAIEREGWAISAFLFADTAEPVGAQVLSMTQPDGKKTDIAAAIQTGIESASASPMAVFVLSDGEANDNRRNNAAISSVLGARTPVIGIGFGSDQSIPTLSVTSVIAPEEVPPKQEFRISARLAAVTSGEIPEFDLVLLKDGKFLEKRKIDRFPGSRFWSETFSVKETEKGIHDYTVQIATPDQKDLMIISAAGNAMVNISEAKDLRILFVQGALSWDYKFISLALKNDQTIKMTGLSRTSEKSYFRQNVETATELESGFPETDEQISRYTVLVLSDMRPSDLTASQQELVSRFCSKMGGGVLMIGGSETFDASWKSSKLEEMLPVTFDASRGVRGMDQPFQMRLTPEAIQHPVFQINSPEQASKSWSKIPLFRLYGRVANAKPGATVWARHEADEGADGKRILMAVQRYGAGLSCVMCVPDTYLWRLSPEALPEQYDRFWLQLLKYLGQTGQRRVLIEFANQDFLPNSEVSMTIEKRLIGEKTEEKPAGPYHVKVRNPKQEVVSDQTCELEPGQPVEMKFLSKDEGLYTVTVYDSTGIEEVSRSVELRSVNVELQKTARSMENLMQWSSLSGGISLPVEECADTAKMISLVKEKIEQAEAERRHRRPLGMDGMSLLIVLGCLGGEWALRKRWNLI